MHRLLCSILEPPTPINVTVARFNSTTVGVSWAKFTLVELKGLASYVVSYTIIIASRKRVVDGTFMVPWTNNSIIITNLQAGAQYRISVRTSTSAGMSGICDNSLLHLEINDDMFLFYVYRAC